MSAWERWRFFLLFLWLVWAVVVVMGFWLFVGFMGKIKVFHYRQNRGAFQVKILLTHNHSQKQNTPLTKHGNELVAALVQGRL